jgi:hypothetical protein
MSWRSSRQLAHLAPAKVEKSEENSNAERAFTGPVLQLMSRFHVLL